MVLHDNATNNFTESLPCHDCLMRELCKHRKDISPVAIPEFLELHIECQYHRDIETAMYKEKADGVNKERTNQPNQEQHNRRVVKQDN